MKPAKIYEVVPSPDDWSEFIKGSWLQEQQQAFLDQYLPSVFGYHLLKLGSLSSELSCHASSVKNQLNIGPDGELIAVRSSLEDLAVQESSVDMCLLSHVLDFTHDPHQVLREAERCLTADGYLVVSGLNPLSLCGLYGVFPSHRKKMPWSGRMFTPARVKDWLELLGFEVLQDERFAFSRLKTGKPPYPRLEKLGKAYTPALASAYLLVARKRTMPLTPMKKAWRIKARLPVRGLSS